MKPKQQLAKVTRALRRGMKLVKAGHGGYFANAWIDDGKADPKKCRACAVGTILLGAGVAKFDKSGVAYTASFGGLGYIRIVNGLAPDVRLLCPVIDPRPGRSRCYESENACGVGELTEHLFEGHEWTRGKIARYLERQIKLIDNATGKVAA